MLNLKLLQLLRIILLGFQCHDVFTNNYCPRGPFCAFAHADHEMSINRILPTDTNLGDILQNVLPPSSTSSSGTSVATAITPVGVGPIGSKPGDPTIITNNGNSSNGNGNAAAMMGGVTNSGSVSSNLGISNANGLDGIGGFLGGLPDFSDVLRNSCRSPPEQQQILNNHHGGGSGVPFGAQSFASAVSSYSGVAASGGGPSDNRSSSNNSSISNINNGSHSAVAGASGILNHHPHHHGGKFFDGKPLVGSSSSSTVPGSFDMVSNLMNGPMGSWKAGGNNGTPLGNPSLYDNIDNAFSLGFPMEPDRDYSLFPSAGLSRSKFVLLNSGRKW